MSDIYVIYKHTAPSGKSYIGQTKRLEKRNKDHQYFTGCRAFYHAIKKYGWDNFTHEILAENLTLDQANQLEGEFISKHNTLQPHAYNIHSGGKNYVVSDEKKQRISNALKGRIITPEHRIKMSLASKGKPKTLEHRQKMSEVRRGRPAWNKGKTTKLPKQPRLPRLPYTHSEEVRRRMSELHIGKVQSDETKLRRSKAISGRKWKLDPNTGKRIWYRPEDPI